MKYLLDANVLIEAYRRYYAFDLAPKFWDELINHSEKGKIVCIDRVKRELLKGNDELADWIDRCSCPFLNTGDPKTLTAYAEVMQWAMDEPRFFPEAKSEFARVADAWIVAYAKAHDCVVTTMEMPDRNGRRRIKIPDACDVFSVPYVNTFSMLRQLGVKFT